LQRPASSQNGPQGIEPTAHREARTKKIGRRGSRRNPAGRTRREVAQAARALENFTGDPAEYLEAYELPNAAAGWELGPVAELSYIGVRDGEQYEFVHRFKQKSRPLLIASADGTELIILGGGYSVTERGIEDR